MNFLLHGKALEVTPEINKNINKSFTLILYEKLLEYPEDRIAAIDAITKESITYHQILKNGMGIAKLLCSLGARDGDRVMIICANNIYYHQYLIGSLLAEAVLCPLNPVSTSYELEHMCKVLQPKIIISTQCALKKVQALQLKFGYKIIEFSTSQNSEQVFTDLEFPILQKPYIEEMNAPIFTMSSSGTTGLSKGVIHTHASFKGLLNILKDSHFNAQDGDVTLGLLPFFHAIGLIGLMGNLYCGQKMIVLDKFKPNLFFAAIQEFKINKTFIVPTVGLFLAQYTEMDKYNLTSLKEIICAGAALSSSILNSIKNRVNVDVRVGYGMSEAGFVSLMPPTHFVEPVKSVGSSGLLLPLFTGKILDLETRKPLPANKLGELCIKSICNFSGYYDNTIETQNAIDVDGYIHSGDLAYYDDSGYLYVVDRLKELIKHKGYQVSPVELECILLKHESVKDVAVLGVPDEKCGELPRAFVILKEDNDQNKSEYNNGTMNKKRENSVTETELQEFVASFVSPYKQLTGGVEFVDEIPKNSGGKILRRKMKEMYISLKK